MTEQRERVSTDPGIGPVDADNTATLRSIEAAVEVEPDGVSVYYEPKPLVAVSDHRTLEMQSVKLARDIDPRKLQTELSLPRSPAPPQYDSGWPQADLVLTTSQPPAPIGRRWRVPALLCGVLVALLLLVLARSSAQHAAERRAASTLRVEAIVLPAPTLKVGSATPVLPAALSVAALKASAVSAPSAAASNAAASNAAASNAAASNATALPSASPAPSGALAGHAAVPAVVVSPPATLKASAQPSASGSTLSAPTVKPKRAIY